MSVRAAAYHIAGHELHHVASIRNNYPRAIRGSLRDMVSYLWTDLIVDTGGWRFFALTAEKTLPLQGKHQ